MWCYIQAILAEYSPVLVSSHTLLINWSRQLLGVWEDVVVVQYDRFDDLIHVRLTSHLVQRVRRGQEGGAEYNSQVPSIHHVFITVLGKAGRMGNCVLKRVEKVSPTTKISSSSHDLYKCAHE